MCKNLKQFNDFIDKKADKVTKIADIMTNDYSETLKMIARLHPDVQNDEMISAIVNFSLRLINYISKKEDVADDLRNTAMHAAAKEMEKMAKDFDRKCKDKRK